MTQKCGVFNFTNVLIGLTEFVLNYFIIIIIVFLISLFMVFTQKCGFFNFVTTAVM